MPNMVVSQVQKHFMISEIYKRSKEIFDVTKLNQLDNNGSKSRRKPIEQIDKMDKMDSSFMSSKDYFIRQRENQIEKRRKNASIFIDDLDDDTQTNCSLATGYPFQKTKKSFDMNKSLPRQFYGAQKSQSKLIEDHFASFSQSDFQKGQNSKSIDFRKILGRKETMPSDLKGLRNDKVKKDQSNPQNVKTYQKNIYDQTIFKCLFDLQKDRKAENRRSVKLELETQRSLPKQIDFERLQNARKFSKKKPKAVNLMFFHGKGKEQLSQMHTKTLKANENYWIEEIKRIKKQDFQTVKLREQMADRRKQEIRKRRQVTDQRGEICDAKYFLRQESRRRRNI